MSHIYKKMREGQKVKGTLTYTNFLLETPRAHEIDAELQAADRISPARYLGLLNELRSICKPPRVLEVHNMVVLTGRSMQAARLAGDTTYTGIINYGALGTGSTAVADSDTVLDTEVKRKSVATVSQTDDQISIDFYYSKSDTSGTYQEFGMFVDGTGTVDTGLMFNRSLTGGWTKSSSEAMTVSIQVNINAV